MDKFVRNNAWNNGGDFSNQDLYWYAKGVRAMMNRALDDQMSWWFFAAIHGEYVTPENTQGLDGFPKWANITAPPKVPTSPLPSDKVIGVYWNQCQHQSWYFPPWHRGYLMALEAQLRKDIIAQGGPTTWALPYWDYFGGPNGSQYTMPPAFARQTMDDGSPNPLFVAMRYGPNNDGNIFLPTTAWRKANPTAKPRTVDLVTEKVLGNNLYTGSNAQTSSPGFGGPQTGFNHLGDYPNGNLEKNPHNYVHNFVGGSVSRTNYGLMGDPGTAALDPIFYMHHCNIDRMWAEWNAMGNSNPTDTAWLNGPKRTFVMPWGGKAWYFTPMQVAKLGDLNYSYQDLGATPKARENPLATRLAALKKSAPGATAVAADRAADEGPALMTLAKPPELLGANGRDVRLSGAGAHAVSIKLDADVRRKVANSFAKIAHGSAPDRTYLTLEGVRGDFDAAVLNVYINLPDAAKPEDHADLLVGGAALFGLRQASKKDGEHGGGGLTLHVDITDAIDRLHLDNAFDIGSLNVSLAPHQPLPDGVEITVDRIGVYRQEL